MSPPVLERRDWLYWAYGATVVQRLVWPSEEPESSRLLAALVLPLVALTVARATQREIWHRTAGAALLVAGLVHIVMGGSRAAQALHDPLFWGLAATLALGVSALTGRWPVAAATASALAGAGTIVAILMPVFQDFESHVPMLTLDAPRQSFAALSNQLGVPATICLFGLWLQGIAVEGRRKHNAGRISAASRGALLAALALALAGAAAQVSLSAGTMAALGVLLGLAEAQARTPRIVPSVMLMRWRRINPVHWTPIAVLLLLELLFSLLLLHAPGTGDVPSFWIAWSDTMVTNGLVDGYRLNNTDYPPLSAIMFFLIAKAALGASSTIFLGLKISLVALLFVTTYCFWRWSSDMLLTSLLACSLYISGVALGYVDLYYAPTMILSLWALQQRRLALFSVCFALTCLIKWQPLIVAPFLVLHAVSTRSRSERDRPSLTRRWGELVAPALALLVLMMAVFGLDPIMRSLARALQHTYLSGTALNFNWLVTYYLEVFRPEVYGGLRNGLVSLVHVDLQLLWVRLIRLAFVLFYVGALWRLFKSRGSFTMAIECAVVGYLSYFIVNIGVHENHLFIGTVISAAAAALAPGRITRAVLINAMSSLNLIAFYGITGEPLGFAPIVGIDVTVIFAAVNVLLFLAFWGDVVSPTTLIAWRAPASSRAVSQP